MGSNTIASGEQSDRGGDTSQNRSLLNWTLLIIIVSLLCVLYEAIAPAVPTARSLGFLPTVISADQTDVWHLDSAEVRLERVLTEAAMENRTIILTTLNAAWSDPGSVIDLYIESFRTGEDTRSLLDHLVIVSLDMRAYSRCLWIHKHCFLLLTEGVDFSGQKDFLSDGYLKMMWQRIDFLRAVLEKGFSFIFSDADIMWFRNPFPHFHNDADFQIACDHFTGDPFDMRNLANGGFKYVKSNNRTIEFYKFWYNSRLKYPGRGNQKVLNFIKKDPFVAEIGIKIRFLSTEYFGGFCELSRNFTKVCTMHANCCIGLPSKMHDLRIMLEDWRNYTTLQPEVNQVNGYKWRVPQNCSLDALKSKNNTRH